MSASSLTSIKILFNNYKSYPFFSKSVAEEQAELYKDHNAKVYTIPPESNDSELVLNSATAYFVVYQDNGRYRVVDMDGSFTISEEDFNLLKIV